ncbi:MAG: hypothetical protein M1833_003997 [Piccolia ochrophora]|nr:MAG: hypothetical protein M1833_003997 [Piccolia ochrophora]
MRLIAIPSVLCSVAAFILGMLCIFAGSKPGFLEDAAVITLNTTNLGKNATALLDATSTSTGPLDSLPTRLSGVVDNVTDTVADFVVDALGISEFYSVHLLDYCQGSYTPSPTDEDAEKNVTYCSPRKGLIDFNLTQILEEELNTEDTNVGIDDLGLTDQVDDASRIIELAARVTFICYVLGVAMAGFSIFLGIIGVLSNGRLWASINFMFAFITFAVLGAASGVITSGATRGVNAINKYGEPIGLSAYRSTKLLGMTWSATALMLIAAVLWLASCIFTPRKR